MTHEAAIKAIDGAIYRAEENLEDAAQLATDAITNANRAKAAWEKQQQEAERRQGVAAGYRAELHELRLSKAALDRTVAEP